MIGLRNGVFVRDLGAPLLRIWWPATGSYEKLTFHDNEKRNCSIFTYQCVALM
jgi:hypothetical protein